MLVQGVGALTSVWLLNSLKRKDTTLRAKSETKLVQINGFVGRPETRTVVNYLKWRNIKFEIAEVINAHTAQVDKLPHVTIDGLNISGSSEVISILETLENFQGSLNVYEVFDRYPKTKVNMWTESDDILSRFELLNKYRVQFPDYPDLPAKEKLIHEIEQERASAIRELLFENLRPNVLYMQHRSFLTSLIYSFKIASESGLGPIPILSPAFFGFCYGLNMYVNAKKVNTELMERLNEQRGQSLSNYNCLEMEIAKTISQMTRIKSSDKFFAGREPGVADIEVYTLLSILDLEVCQRILENLSDSAFRRWFNRMQSLNIITE